MNIAICDDNMLERENNLNRVNGYLRENDLHAEVMTFQSGEDLIQYMQVNKQFFDIVILDIYMQSMSGIETAKIIRESDSTCHIIFLTTSTAHAVESYDVRATYYLTKPIVAEKLNKALHTATQGLQCVQCQFVIVKNHRQYFKLFFNDLLYAESKARIILLHTKHNGVVSVYSKLNDFEAQLRDARFLRCHKSYLVNLDYVLEIKDSSFFMENSISVPISSSMKNVKRNYMAHLVKGI
ncbi:MAG: response regulator transcription factor [Hyphomonadaceae bacterium]|nr:response regulator transcription factor [Clostridia bacterium]